MDISRCRFLHQRTANPPDLYSSSQDVLLSLLCGVSWRSVGRVRRWALPSLPASIRESLLLEVFRRWEGRGQDRKKVVQKLWSILSTINIINLDIPPWIDEQTRKSIITYINPGPAPVSSSPLRVFNSLVTKEDVHAVVNLLRISPNLTNVHIRRGANDDLLDVLGEHCQSLREINMACSTGVTDEGIRRMLLGEGDNCDNPRACHKTLTHVKLRGTRVRRDGIRLLLSYCLSLQGVRCNIMDVLQALSAFFKEDHQRFDGSPLTLRYFDFSSCYQIFSTRLGQLQCLEEVRIGADVPPECRRLRWGRHGPHTRPPTDQVIESLCCLAQLPALTTLILKDVTNIELEAVLRKCGHRLRRLELHFMQAGVDLCVVSSHAAHLSHLAISDSRVLCSEPHLPGRFLPHLTSCFLMRVTYSEDSDPVILERAQSLTVLHMEAGPLITDDLIRRLVSEAQCGNLEELIINGSCELTIASVELLTSLPRLKRLGDLLDWRLGEADRQLVVSYLGSKWDTKLGNTKKMQF